MSLSLNSNSGNVSFVESNNFNRSHHLHIPASNTIFPSDKVSSNKNDVLQNSTVESCKSTMPAESEPLSSSQLSSASSSEISSSTSSSLLLHFRTHSAQQNASMCTDSEHDTSSVIRNLSQTQIMNSSQRSKKWSGNVTPTRVCHGESSSFELLHDAVMHTSDHGKSTSVNNEISSVDGHETETFTRRKMENSQDQVKDEVTNKIAEFDTQNNFTSINDKENNINNNETDIANKIENNESNIVNNNDADTSDSLSYNVEMPTELLFIDNADGTAYLTDVSVCDDGSLLLHETVLLAQSVESELTHELIEPNALKLSTVRDESKSPIPLTPSSSLLPHQIRWNEYEAKERTELHEPLCLSHHTTSNKEISKRKRPIRVARVVRERAVSRHDPNSNDKVITTIINEESYAESNKNNNKYNYSTLHNTDTSKKAHMENLFTKMQGNSINDWQLQATVLKYDDSIRRLKVSFVNDELSNPMCNCTNEEVYHPNTSRQRSASPTAINPDGSEALQNDQHHVNNNNKNNIISNNSDKRNEEGQEDSDYEDEDDNDDWSQWQPSTNVETFQASTSPSFAPTQHDHDHPWANTQTSCSLSSLTLSRTPVITLHTLHTEGWIPVHLVQHSDKLMKTPEKAEEVQVNAKLSIPSSTAKSMESCTLPNNSAVNTCTPPDFRRKPSDHKYYSTQNRLSLSPVPITPEGSINIPRHTQRNDEEEMNHHNKLYTEQVREHEERNLREEEEEEEEEEYEKQECDEMSPEREGSLSRISAFCSIDNSSLATSLSMSTMASVRRRLNFSVNTSPLPNEQCQRYSAQTSMIVPNHSDQVHDRHNNSININNNDADNDHQKVIECKRNCTIPERRQASMSPLPCLQSLLVHENRHISNNAENSSNSSYKEDTEMEDDASSREASLERGAGTTPLLPLSVWSCNEIRDFSIDNNGKHHNKHDKNFNTSVHSYAKHYPLTSSTQIWEDPLKSSVCSMAFSPSASLSMSAAMQLSDLLTSLSFQRSMADSSMHGELAALQESLREFGISLSIPLSQSTCSTISTMESNCINNHVNCTNCIGNNSMCNNKNELDESCSLSQYSHPFVNFTQIFSEPLSSRLRTKRQNYFTTSLFSSSLSSASRGSSSHASQKAAWWHMNNKGNDRSNVNILPNQEKHLPFHHKSTKVQNQFQSEYMQRHSGENNSTQGSRTSSNFTTTYCRQPVRLSSNMSRRSSYTSQNSTFSVYSNSNGANNEGNINTKSSNIENKCSNNKNNKSYKVQQNDVFSALYAQENLIAPKQHHMDPESANFGNTKHSDKFSSSTTSIDNNNVYSGSTLLNDESTSASLSMRVCERVDFAHQSNNEMSVKESSNRDDGRNSNGIQWHSIKLPPKTRSQMHNKSKAAIHAQHQINFKNVMKARANKAGKNGNARTESQRRHNNTLIGTVIPDTSVFLPFSPLSITPESSLNLQEWQPHSTVNDKIHTSETYQEQILTQEYKMQRANVERNQMNKAIEESNISSNCDKDNKENEIRKNLVSTHEYTGLHALDPSSINVQTHDGKFSIETIKSKKCNVTPNESETVATMK